MPEETRGASSLGLAVFGPQTNAPQPEYLDKLRDYIHSHFHLRKLVCEALCLSDTWDVLAKHRQDIAALQGGRKHLDALAAWLRRGPSTAVASEVSGILCMPLLVLIEISQYFQFLENTGSSHSDVLASLRQGKGAGVQGYCAGLLPAFAVATAQDEESVIVNAAKAMRLGLAIGAYAELGDDMTVKGNTTIVVRLRNTAQAAEDITNKFPGTYIGAITDPRTVGIVGPVDTLRQVAKYIQAEGVMSQSIHLRGKNHNPENAMLATDLYELSEKFESLQLGNSDQLLVRVDSNREGKTLLGPPHRNLSHEAVFSMLTSSAHWDMVLRDAAESLRSSSIGLSDPTCPNLIALFGIGDPVPLAPFHQAGVRVTKLEMSRIAGPWRSNGNGTDGIPPLGEPKAWDVPFRAACVSNFVDAGSNAALVCCEAPPITPSLESARWGAVPILISAATKSSLVSYCRKLESYLQRNAVSIAQAAYTLATRRKHHRFRWSAIVSSTHELRQSLGRIGENDVAEVLLPHPRAVKRVVLAFGGQNQRFVGLNKAVYDCNPRFQYHLHACDEELGRLGFPSLLPSIFSRDPVADIVLLQTGTFAVQYASSRCWIDGGLQVDAVIGHSFGELTALVISNTVSLQAGLTIVACRALLMTSKWGPERGSMLAVHSTLEAISGLIVEDVEVACYNAERSVVLVGSSKAMTRLEHDLGHDPKYAGIRYQRLDVSHGFHSKLTEPLLDDLRAITRSISFQQPDIPLETCTLDPCSPQSLGSIYLANHMRKPVYFAHAVQRIEQRFGPCIWLEAGLDSSIISMVRRAVTRTKSDHIFQPVSSGRKQDRGNEVPSVVTRLWKAGCTVLFWPFLSAEEAGFSSIWIPPYSFDRESTWIEKVDLPVSAASVDISSPGPIHSLCELLRRSESSISAIAERQGFRNYWKEVAPRQDAIVLAYVLECFKGLHVDVGLLKPGSAIPPIDYLPRHAKLMNRMIQILQKHSIIESGICRDLSSAVRGAEICPPKPSNLLVDELTDDFPFYRSESRLLSITVSKLAPYLIGKKDLLFSSQESQKILQDFYVQSPLLATVAEFLASVMGRCLAEGKPTDTVRILEMGARCKSMMKIVARQGETDKEALCYSRGIHGSLARCEGMRRPENRIHVYRPELSSRKSSIQSIR
ncbi:hypothetical protein F4818DRAFT_425658 [Hypoxylon cercidicola]|nr:hypothetical protein F4818DRAFT_425658 [Hypoxylon cercidicola]